MLITQLTLFIYIYLHIITIKQQHIFSFLFFLWIYWTMLFIVATGNWDRHKIFLVMCQLDMALVYLKKCNHKQQGSNAEEVLKIIKMTARIPSYMLTFSPLKNTRLIFLLEIEGGHGPYHQKKISMRNSHAHIHISMVSSFCTLYTAYDYCCLRYIINLLLLF